MITRHGNPCLFLFILLLSTASLSAQSVEQVRNDAYRYGVRTIDGVQVFFIDEVNPVLPREVRVPRRVLRIPFEGTAPFDVVVKDARMSDAVDATPFYLVQMNMAADSTILTRIVPQDVPTADPAVGRGVEVLSRRIVYERKRPMLEIELPLVLWDPQTRQTRWIEEYTLLRVPSDGQAGAVAAEGKPPYASMPFTTRSKNVDTSQAWIDFTAPMVKFFVRQDGLYKITAEWMRDAGKDPAQVDPARVQLYRKGVPIPMYAVGMDDGRFDDGDYFVFPGMRNYDEGGYRHLPASIDDPYPQYLSIYTDSTAYWLHFNFDGAARAEVRTPITPLPADTLDWTYETVHLEYDPWDQLLPHTTDLVRGQTSDWTSEDTWAMGQLYFNPSDPRPSTEFSQPFRVSAVYPNANARFWGKILSWYGDRNQVPNHSATLSVNKQPSLDSIVFQHDEQILLYGTQSALTLREDTLNTIKTISWNINTAGSATRLDWFDVEYPRYLVLEGPSHVFRIDSVFSDGPKSLKFQGSQTPAPVILRVRDGRTSIMSVAAVQGSGPFTVFVSDSVSPGDVFYVWNADSIPPAVKGETVTVSRLDLEEAEHLMITARFLETATREYADFIGSSYGVSTRVVAVEDIYDLYSYGMFQPEAIKLLTYDAYYNGKTDTLKYLFLVGDANYNYRAWFTSNVVPSYGNPVSDTWFVAFDSLSAVPQLQVGRLPVRDESSVRQYLARHQSYRAQEPTLWNKSALHFSGGNLSGGEAELQRYKSVNDFLISSVVEQPEFSGRAAHFYKTLDPQSDFGPLPLTDVRSRIAEGGVFICYVGHSGTQTWDNSISRADQLANSAGRAALVTDFGCSTGRYAEPDYNAFSEIFVVGDQSHAIAYIGNSAAGFDFTATVLPGLFYKELITQHAPSIGYAHYMTRLQLGTWNAVNRVSIQTNTLVGDPIVALDMPKQRNPIVKDSWIRPTPEIITDVMDSVSFTVTVGNYGLQTPDSLDVLVENLFNAAVISSDRLTVPMPALYDTLRFRFGLTKTAGSGLLRVTLDPDGKLEEIFENDNLAVLDYKIFSTFLKVVNDQLGNISSRGTDITILNPALDQGAVSTITVESDLTTQFSAPARVTLPYGKTMSSGDVPSLFPAGAKRYWRVKLDASGQDFVGPYIRRNTAVPSDFVQTDSVEFLPTTLDFVRYDSGIGFPPGRRVELLSSNFTLGSGVHISIDGVNVLPSSIAWAYCIAIVDSASLIVKRVGVFDNYNYPESRDSIRRWAEEVDFGEYFMVTTGNEPKAGSNIFSEQIKALGSKYIDSVRTKAWRPSWAFIGRRGAPIGTMPEVYYPEAMRLPGIIDTTFYVAPDTGKAISPPIGPALRWETARLERSDPAISDIRLSIYGIRKNQQEDLLLEAGNVTEADLSSIDGAIYPYIRMQAAFYPQGGDPLAAKLHAWSVSYTQPPELALNYQSVAMLQDSVQQGEPAEIEIGILNAGEGDAAAFPVQLEVVGSDNIPRPAGQFTVAGLRSGQWFDTTATINTDFLSGAYQVFVRVDRDDIVLEQYEDNNTFVSSVYVKPDTSRPQLDVTFDGFAPIDDDYIRYNPEIVLTLRSDNPVPVSSKDNFTVTIDGEAMDLDSIGFTMTPASNGQPATLRFQPTLKDGIYYFGFNAEDAKKTPVYDEVPEVRLRVSTQSRIAEMYNYPNPFQGETSFTFLLTGVEPPQEVEVKVYTVAGRLIRRISYPASSMRIGYNALKWDGRDEDGDELANGVYFYKIIAKFTDESFENIGRMAVMR
ncbi:MAG: hypothetical protein IH600_08310 [Bacteroidetes bacterium]|nr:hypothetical protein [Bacteroidota bacterium]